MGIFESISAERILTKEHKEVLLRALRSELQQIQSILAKQQLWFSKLRNDLGINTYSRITHIPLPRAIYDRHLPTFYSCLEPEDLRLLHLAYSYLSIIDATLARFDSIVEASKNTYPEYQRYAGAQMRVDELQRTGQKAQDIISHHLTGTKLQYVHTETHLS